MRPLPADLYLHPRELVVEGIADYGRHAVIDTALTLLAGELDYDTLPVPLLYLGGVHALALTERGFVVERAQDFWPRTWGARTLLHVWEPYVVPDLLRGFTDPHWRVREMTAKVAVSRRVEEAADLLLVCLADDVPRVRVAAMRAAAIVGGEDHLERIASLPSPDRRVGVARSTALRELAWRLDRPVPADD